MNELYKKMAAFTLALTSIGATPLHAQDTEESTLHWKNGDILPGALRESDRGKINWESSFFSEEISIDTTALDRIAFSNEIATPEGAYRVGTVTGDVFTGNLLSANENTFEFLTKQYGKIQVARSAIYALDRRDNPNIIFGGRQLRDWVLSGTGPIKDMTYKVYQGANDGVNDFSKLTPTSQGYFSAGWLDVRLSEFDDNFRMQFEGTIETNVEGDYKFETSADDGARVFVDGTRVTNQGFGRDHMPQGEIHLSKGPHTIRVDYFENGGAARLDVWWTGPELFRARLYGKNPGTGWNRGPGGHPTTERSKVSIFREVELPEKFEIEIELAATQGPRFVFAIARTQLSATLNNTFRLETWDDELVAVRDTVFEPVLTIKEGQRQVRLRLAFDTIAKQLEIFDANGQLLITVPDVQPVIGKSGILIRNRGENLTIRNLSIRNQSQAIQRQPIDSTRPRVHLADGPAVYGRLFVENNSAHVLHDDGTRQFIDLSRLERIAVPDIKLQPVAQTSELTYADGAIIRGEIESATPEQIIIQTAFSQRPVACTLEGATALFFGAAETEKSSRPKGDQLLSSIGRLRGDLTFDLAEAPLSWKPQGAQKSLKLAVTGGARIERREPKSDGETFFNKEEYPFVLHLVNGEMIACTISSYSDETVEFQSPFIEARQISTKHIKAIEFEELRQGLVKKKTPRSVEASTAVFIRDTEKAYTKQSEADRKAEQRQKNLDRALTVPRSNRDSPPSHVLVANNGDMKRGKLLSVNREALQFESKLRPIIVPTDRMHKVVHVAAHDEEDEKQSAPAPPLADHQIRVVLFDAHVLLFTPVESAGGKLRGHSSVYGELSIPVNAIQEITFGDFESDRIQYAYKDWVVHDAMEPQFDKAPVHKPPPESLFTRIDREIEKLKKKELTE